MHALRQRITNFLDWSEVDKCIALMWVLALTLISYSVTDLVLLNVSMSAELVYAESTKLMFIHKLGLSAGALIIAGIGWRIRTINPNALWIQFVAAIYYSLSLLYCNYYIGLPNFCTGVVLLGTPVFGFIVANRAVVWVATIISLTVILVVAYCTALGLIAYAPMMVPPTTQTTHVILTTLLLWFAAPHFLVIILFTDHVVNYWRTRENIVRVLSYTDTLTQLLNRHSIMEHLTTEIARSQRAHAQLSIVIVDLDNFKKVNDTWGHPVGDSVLKKAAAVLNAQIRQCDMLGRYGGEEFMMILPDTPLEGAAILIERCRETLENSYILLETGEKLRVTASFGLASNAHNTNIELSELVKKADEALYKAKANGRNRVELAT